MSWEAVAWANRQKLKKSYEQIVLLVIANAADPQGEAFSKWPGRDHWWTYLSERTRLPKSSLFRHLNTLMALGLGERAMQVLADGSRRPTFKLNLAASFDIDNEEDEERYNCIFEKIPDSQSPVETGHDDGSEHLEKDNDISEPQGQIASIAPQSPVETGNPNPSVPSPETEPVPVLRLHRDSKSVPKDSPLPPSGGPPARDDLWEAFVGSWGEPIPKMQLARREWDHSETARRGEIVAAAKGYWAWLRGHTKPPPPVSAQSFLRDAGGWAQWLRYAPDASGAAPAIVSGYAFNTPEAKALATLYEVAGKTDFFRSVKCRGGQASHSKPINPRLLALARAPARTEWVTLDRQQAAAWDSLISENVQFTRTRLSEGAAAPWSWPPRKDGTLSTAPPDGAPALTEDDLNALAGERS